MWWLDRAGILDDTTESVFDADTSRQAPSFQLVGRSDNANIDLQRLHRAGVIVTGRLAAVDGHRLYFDDDLLKTTVAADVKLAGLLSRLDRVATGITELVGQPEPFEPLWPGFVSAPTDLDLTEMGIETVVWATGYRRTYPWLRIPLLDARGELRHHGGVTPLDGVYALGLPFQRTRKSAFIDGVGNDARVLTAHIASRLGLGSHSASESRERATRTERAGEAARESACRGV
jgi:putative flavoprotein involved in K+ transport